MGNEKSEVVDQTTCSQGDGDDGQLLREQLLDACNAAEKIEASISGLLLQVKEGKYWQKWGYRSFEQFVDHECPFGVRKAEQLIQVRKTFTALGISSEQIESLAWSKAALIAPVITSDNMEEMLAAVQNESLRTLRDMVREIARSESNANRESLHSSATVPAINGSNGMRANESSDDDWLLDYPFADEFYVAPAVWAQLCFAIHSGQQALLIGESGCGKSELVYRLAQVAQRKLHAFNFGGMSEPRSALIGNTHLDKKNGTYFRKSRFVGAVTTPGTCILLDELTRSSRDGFNIILPLLDGQGYIALDESEDAAVVHRADNVKFFATANVGNEYTGTGRLDQALLDRFSIVIQLDFPPLEEELKLLLSRCSGLQREDAQRLLEITHAQRQQARDGDFVSSISTRSLFAAGDQIAAGIGLAAAFTYTVLMRFSDEGGDFSERARLRQLLTRFTPN